MLQEKENFDWLGKIVKIDLFLTAHAKKKGERGTT